MTTDRRGGQSANVVNTTVYDTEGAVQDDPTLRVTAGTRTTTVYTTGGPGPVAAARVGLG